MRAVLLKNFSTPDDLSIEDVPLPPLERGTVLVKMAAAPINPSDLIFLRNQYGVKKPLPVVPGFEGSGTVMDAGGGLYPKWLIGKRVACRAPENGHGTWAEFMVCPASSCIPLKESISLDQGATLIVNPLTAWSLLALAKKQGHRAFVQTAAASALGKMIARLGSRFGMEGIHIVHRQEQVGILKGEGFRTILDSSQIGFHEELQDLSKKMKATIAFDAVGGSATTILSAYMPKGSTIIVYGALSGEPCSVSPTDLIFKGITVTGFWLSEEAKKMSLFKKLRMASKVQDLLGHDLATKIHARFPLEKVKEAIDIYRKHRTQGKVLLTP